MKTAEDLTKPWVADYHRVEFYPETLILLIKEAQRDALDAAAAVAMKYMEAADEERFRTAEAIAAEIYDLKNIVEPR